jgi:hypothetical protein
MGERGSEIIYHREVKRVDKRDDCGRFGNVLQKKDISEARRVVVVEGVPWGECVVLCYLL